MLYKVNIFYENDKKLPIHKPSYKRHPILNMN